MGFWFCFVLISFQSLRALLRAGVSQTNCPAAVSRCSQWAQLAPGPCVGPQQWPFLVLLWTLFSAVLPDVPGVSTEIIFFSLFFVLVKISHLSFNTVIREGCLRGCRWRTPVPADFSQQTLVCSLDISTETRLQIRKISFSRLSDYNFYIASILLSLECVEFRDRIFLLYLKCTGWHGFTLLKLLVKSKYIDWYKDHQSFDVFLIQADIVLLFLASLASWVLHFFYKLKKARPSTSKNITICFIVRPALLWLSRMGSAVSAKPVWAQ